jgi:hypothetical protein
MTSPTSGIIEAADAVVEAACQHHDDIPDKLTILHELSHAVAFKRGISDTSNKGRYHNAKFREIALEMGIHVEQAGTLGWSETTVPDTTREFYKTQVKQLVEAITTYREGYIEGGVAKPKTAKTQPRMVCGCEDSIAVSKKWYKSVGQFATCGICGWTFELEE